MFSIWSLHAIGFLIFILQAQVLQGSINLHQRLQQLPPNRTKDAYVTLLYGGFLLGARVLGQSLRDTGTERNLIALCTEAVSDATKEILEADGWIIQPVTNIHSPYQGKSRRGDYFSGIFSKLHVWNMTDYDRIIYLDSDALVVQNIDHLFDCGTFCAAFRHSDLFNAGIIVVQPSYSIFNDMLGKIPHLSSYDDGDQGFLNTYFKDLIYAPFFNWSNSARQGHPMRMAAGLNADIGMYYMYSRWLIPEDEIKIIHYTLGPIKPWIWWTHFLFDLNMRWTKVRKRLPQYAFHRGVHESAWYLSMYWAPYLILVFLCIGIRIIECYCHTLFYSKFVSRHLKRFTSVNSKYSHFFPLTFLLLSYYLAYKVVPTTMIPSHGEYVFWLWSNFFLLIFMGLYCYLCHVIRIRYDNQPCKKYLSTSHKKCHTLVSYIIFFASYVMLKLIPPLTKSIFRRVTIFLLLFGVHLAMSHIAGSWIIKMWTTY